MIKTKAIAVYKKRHSGILCCVLLAILAILLSFDAARAQEPILITPMQAEDYYESLSIDSEAVSEDEEDLKQPVSSEVDIVEVTDFDLSADSVAVDDDSEEEIKVSKKVNTAENLKPQKIEENEDIPLIEDNEDIEFFDDEDEDGNILTADTVAVPDAPNVEKVEVSKKDGKPNLPSSQVIRYAKRFWDEAEEKYDKHNIDISGTKTFEMKKSKVSGDVSHFSTEHYDCYPGFKMNQSLHLEIDGNIDEKSTVHAVLDDTEDEDRKFTVTIDSNKWKFVLGDFPIALKGSKFALYSKEVRGVMAQGYFHNKVRSTFLYTQSKGLSRREQFRGAGQQQEYRLQVSPIVQESEKVYIDGIQLIRGTDYQIDYEEGIVKFAQSVLPIEMTRWIVVEYESNDEDMAFTRNLFGTRHEYIRSEGRTIGVTWLREFDHSSPKAGADVDNASGTITPMTHDIYEADIDWKLGKGFSVTGEYAVSKYDPNIKAETLDEDKEITGYAASFGVNGKTNKIEASASYDRVDSKFKTIGREDGVIELGERGLVDDIISSKANLTYKFDHVWSGFADGEKSRTNIDNNPAESKIDFVKYNGGFIWERNNENRFEVRSGRQSDKEFLDFGTTINSDMTKDSSSVVYDRQVGKVKTQSKAERIAYKDDINVASDSEVIELNFNMSSQLDEKISWTAGVSRITVEDEIVLKGLRSETTNYELTMNYEPSSKFIVKGEFQFRRADDFYDNSREDSKLADSQIVYEPNDDLKSTFKYKVENTSKITRDPSLDPTQYILPSSLPSYVLEEDQVLNRFENPVEKTTINSTTDYQISKNLAAYIDWRRRDIDDKKTSLNISKTDRKTYELRYTPLEKLSFTTEYETGFSVNHDTVAETRDWLKSFQLRHEMTKGYILEATYEETDEDDIYDNNNDEYKKSKILELQRPVNNKVTLEFGLQHNDIFSKNPSEEFEKRFAVTLTPSSKSQRYKFFANHKNIDAEIKGEYYEGGVNFSQFIGTDTMIDGEVKKVHSTKTNAGEGYDSVVANAKVVITF
ncbi:MAG: hypothetical protein IKO19_06380 [Candidatus Riflebacteria bacterium]|nr:hypothetical protein [Candidatus Riflebacteria bacterium]